MSSFFNYTQAQSMANKQPAGLALPTALKSHLKTQPAVLPSSTSSSSSRMPAKGEQPSPKFKCVKKLGHGAYANVWLALDQVTSENYAVKVIADERNHAAALYEYHLAKKLDHPNIIKTKGCFKTQNGSVMMVQEYACGGDLFTKVEAPIKMTEREVRFYFAQVVRGVQYLHERNIAHRDIKPENVVIDESNVAKICDFGMAEVHGKVVTHGSGTIPYVSPEVLHASTGFVANTCHDIWSLGVVLYVLLTGDFPWQKAHAHDVDYYTYASGDLSRGSWKKFSPELLHLFSRIFVHPNSRITAAELLAALNIPFYVQSRKPSIDISSSDDSISTLSFELTLSSEDSNTPRAAPSPSRASAREAMSY